MPPEYSDRERIAYLETTFKGLPEALKDALLRDSRKVPLGSLIPIESLSIDGLARNFAATGAASDLEPLAYMNVGEAHGVTRLYYPEANMDAFRDRVACRPDCAGHARSLHQFLWWNKIRSVQSQFTAQRKDGDIESQFVLFLKHKGKYFGVDPAAWYYGTQENPWYKVVEGENLRATMDKLLEYFRTATEQSSEYNRATWKDGYQNQTVSLDGIEQILNET